MEQNLLVPKRSIKPYTKDRTKMTTEKDELDNLKAFRPDWECTCSVCEAMPTVGDLGLCGPCTWGESETMGGAWWSDEEEARYLELVVILEAGK